MGAGRVWLGALACAITAAIGAGSATAASDQKFTPMVQDVLAEPTWFRGIDNQVHAQYEVRLTNGFPIPATIRELDVRRPGGESVLRLTGDALAQAISPIGAPSETGSEIPPNSAAIAFIDLEFRRISDLPSRVSQRLTVDVPPGLPIPATSVSTGGRTPVSSTAAVQIDPPLSGPGWAAIIGAHRRAVQPVNGRFINGQRYAVDWNRLDVQNRPAFGDVTTFASNPSYGARVLAVGDAKVVRARDGLPDQPPDSFSPVGADIGDGNYVVLKLGPGVYAGYAHLIPGSVRVEVGDRVESGDLLGKLGNSGNSNGPHLHFQLMDTPSLLNSRAVPFVLREFRVRGLAASLDAFGEAYVNQTPLPMDTSTAGAYRNRAPVGLAVLDFP